jgi:hypothetical protein
MGSKDSIFLSYSPCFPTSLQGDKMKIQTYNPSIKKWILINEATGRVIDYRKEKFEGVKVYEDIADRSIRK